MATTANNQLYPFSTEDGKPIPLDIIRPVGVTVMSFTDSADITLPASYEVVCVRSSVDAIWCFEPATVIADNTPLPSAVALFAGVIANVAIPVATASRITVRGGGVGEVWIQAMQRWVALGLNRQLNRR